MESSKDVDREPSATQFEQKSEDETEEGAGECRDARKCESNIEALGGLDKTQKAHNQPTYQIRPPLSEKFKPMSAKEVIHNVLFDQLSTKVYDAKEARKWSQEIADIIRDKVKELKFKRYKYIVNVVMGEHRGAGVKMGTRCIWDAEADSYAHDNFLNILQTVRASLGLSHPYDNGNYKCCGGTMEQLIFSPFQETIFCVATVYAVYYY